MIDLVNKQVTHDSFGRGNIVNYNDMFIKVLFKSGKKKFVFPDAFSSYLTLSDKNAINMVKRKIREKEKEREKAEIKLKEERALQQKQLFLQRQETLKNRKEHSRVQSVFWVEADEIDKIFNDWKISTGVIKSGKNKDQPRRLARINQSSTCLITTRESDTKEKNRNILGVFMVDVGFSGRNCREGYIPAHPKYRIRLSEEESKKMFFWNYYVNKNHPGNMVWNSGRQRYFENKWMAQILRDMVSLKNDDRDKDYVKAFLEYFCQMNDINKDELPKPSGALKGA